MFSASRHTDYKSDTLSTELLEHVSWLSEFEYPFTYLSKKVGCLTRASHLYLFYLFIYLFIYVPKHIDIHIKIRLKYNTMKKLQIKLIKPKAFKACLPTSGSTPTP